MPTANTLVFDVGSTFTKVTGFRFEMEEGVEVLHVVGRAQSPTTVDDIESGLAAAREALCVTGVEVLADAKLYASSSAAGGLRMVALGYMPRVTVKAAKEVAMNAGARVLEVLSCDDSAEYRVEVLREIRPDIVLITGGTDGGDADALIANAEVVADAVLSVRSKESRSRESRSKETRMAGLSSENEVSNGWSPVVIVAGNREGQGTASDILHKAAIQLWRVPNVLPTIHELRVKPAREAIHNQFIRQITKARGLGKLLDMVEEGKVVPTPGAVLMGAELLARGTHAAEGLGNIMIVDLGGATTDIHSVIPDMEALSIEERGLIVSNEKQVSFRTVEGNLGMRVSACGIVETLGARGVLAYGEASAFAAALLQNPTATLTPDHWSELEERLTRFTEQLEACPETIVPEDEHLESAFDTALATAAVAVALRRHAGHISAEANPVLGIAPGTPVGRDTRMITHVFAVGGVFTHSSPARSHKILKRAFASPGLSLLPNAPAFVVDKHYLLYALGVLGNRNADAVLAFGTRHFGMDAQSVSPASVHN